MSTATSVARHRPLRVALTLWLAVTTAAAGPSVSFVACPIARDTGPDSDLCFLTEYQGQRYALANPPDWGVPQLLHRVLVEGRVIDGPAVCGALPIEGRASVMAEIDTSCDVLLPDDGQVKGSAGGVFKSGSPKQLAFAQDLARRAEQDPRLSLEPVILDPDPLPVPTPPFTQRTLTISYPFDSDRGSGPDMLKLRELALYAKTAGAHQVQVVGHFAESRLDDGSSLVENASIAQARALKIAAILSTLGVDTRVIHSRWEQTATAGTGDGDWRNRLVEVTVVP
jgi:outer membrane protein OmpA-like peptidoglycan-associated protein